MIDLVTDKKDKDILQLLFSYMVEQKMPTDILKKLLVKDDKNNLYVKIHNHAAIQYKSIEGDTFLHLVSKTGFFFEVAESLLDREDIDINAKNDQGDSPLSLALKNNGNAKIMNLLLANPNIDIGSIINISSEYNKKLSQHISINVGLIFAIKQAEDIGKIKELLNLKS